jgi:hypothetical protein
VVLLSCILVRVSAKKQTIGSDGGQRQERDAYYEQFEDSGSLVNQLRKLVQ